ncbi:PRA1 family protein F3-like [Impatiens glandulifera]|uniref:PRA1 family protein F3-like n=1 Tax=Impatiens glandulifera TaxID=253017 RepID=UPI001FB0CF3E|nr:PRA1 family protein F3-like [Impatiens glandulifera]
MTTYGTIPTSTPARGTSDLYYGNGRIQSGFSGRRSWKEMFAFQSISFPSSFSDVLSRIGSNAAYFRVNYAIEALFVLFLSLLWHPVSLIVFVVMMSAWFFLYFLRDEAISIFGRRIDDRIILFILSVLTLVMLFLTDATVNIVVAVVIAAVLVVVHGCLRRTDDLVGWDEEIGTGGSNAAAWRRVALKETASSSFSS